MVLTGTTSFVSEPKLTALQTPATKRVFMDYVKSKDIIQWIDDENNAAISEVSHNVLYSCLYELHDSKDYQRVEFLRKHEFITDSALISLLKDAFTSFYDDQSNHPLLEILERYGPDSTAKIDNDLDILYLCHNTFLPTLKRLNAIGVEIDYEQFLSISCESGEKFELDIFNYALDVGKNFSQECLVKTAHGVLDRLDDLSSDDADTSEWVKAFNRLVEAGLDVNGELDGADLETLAEMALVCYPEFFNLILENGLSQERLNSFDWQELINDFGLKELAIEHLKSLEAKGFTLPKNEIESLLEKHG